MALVKPELLAPAGNLEKLKYACHYGADAVYMGLPTFGLRSNKNAFTWDDLAHGIEYARERNVKVYIAANIFARNHELERIPTYFKKLAELKPDALIVGDPAIIEFAMEHLPDTEIHISTQSSVMNWTTAKFWHRAGAKRIVLARELNLREIKVIKEKNPDLELETFVHGAMCMAYSGRCLISSYINSRDANHGDCTNSCRWEYKLVEGTRPGEYFPVEEDEEGTYFFNSKDLCLISYIPDLINAGVCSFKIEGRTKSAYYLALATRAYRHAIDTYMDDPENFDPIPFLKEVMKTSNRTFTSAFIANEKDSPDMQNHDSGNSVQYYDFVAAVQVYDPERKVAIIEGRNQIKIGDTLEFVTKEKIITKTIEKITDMEGQPVNKIDPNKIYTIDMDEPVDSFTLVRRRNLKLDEAKFNELVNEQYIALAQMKPAKV